jgi:hypothetical protein
MDNGYDIIHDIILLFFRINRNDTKIEKSITKIN